MRGYEQGSGIPSGNEDFSPDSKSAGALILDFPTSLQNGGKKFLLSVSHLVYDILLQQPEWAKNELILYL